MFIAQRRNTEWNDLRKIICLRKSEVSVERVSVCKVIENLAEHGIHYLPFSYLSDGIKALFCQGTKHNSF